MARKIVLLSRITLFALTLSFAGCGKKEEPPPPPPPAPAEPGAPTGGEPASPGPPRGLEVIPKIGDRLDAIDRILETLESGNIAFNAPRLMNLQDTAIIQLLLDMRKTTDELKKMIEAKGEKEGARVRVSDRMEARLTGPNFSITAATPEIQPLSRNDVTTWKWEVKPTSEGRHNLHLTLSAILTVDGVTMLRAIRTFDKTIEVDVSFNQRVGSFVEKNWQWLWTVILVPLGGWWWARRKHT